MADSIGNIDGLLGRIDGARMSDDALLAVRSSQWGEEWEARANMSQVVEAYRHVWGLPISFPGAGESGLQRKIAKEPQGLRTAARTRGLLCWRMGCELGLGTSPVCRSTAFAEDLAGLGMRWGCGRHLFRC